MMSVAANVTPTENARTPSNGPSSAKYRFNSERALRMLSAGSKSKFLEY